MNNGTLADRNEEGTAEDDRGGAAGNVTEGIPPHQGSGEGVAAISGADGRSLDVGIPGSDSDDGKRGNKEESTSTGTDTRNNDANQDDLGGSTGKSPRVSGKRLHARRRDFIVPVGGIKDRYLLET